MDYLNRVAERFSLWAAGGFVVFAGVWIWFLARLDEAARKEVESTRYWWESTSTFESEFKKIQSRGRLIYSMFMALCLFAALVIVAAHVLVP